MKNCLALLSILPCVVASAAPEAMESATNAAPDSVATAATNAAESVVAATNAAERIDVYAIANPAEALEALRRKWLGVAERVPQSVMPDYTSRFRELDRAQGWCNVDLAGRVKVFEDVARVGIRLKIEPQIWYYNLACALARQGKKEEAFAALEQAVAAGYNRDQHAREDEDLAPLRADPRFAKLMAMCGEIKKNWNEPEKPAVIESGALRLDESNVYWSLRGASYRVDVVGATSNTLIYLDHNMEHRPAPLADMVEVKYAAALENQEQAQGPANFNFHDARTGRFIPTILGCERLRYAVNLTNDVESIPATLWADSDAAEIEAWHLDRNVLGVYNVFRDYAFDGVDRILAWSPVPLAYYSKGITNGLERVCAEAWRAMRPDVRERGGVRQLLGVIRRAQKCVASESDLMSPSAQRPVLCFEDIDEKRAVEIAAKLAKPYPEIPRVVYETVLGGMTKPNDLWCEPYELLALSQSRHHVAFAANGAEKTTLIGVGLSREEGELVWKVLQGDPAKVRMGNYRLNKVAKDIEIVGIECDYHEAFDVELPNGKKMKSTRVDIGCFRVKDGVASLPAIISISYPPAESRKYGVDGLLKSIDYTKPQVPGWTPWRFPKANFRDEFRWDLGGECLGWTRISHEGNRTEFTRDGLAVMTRDRLGRPKDVRRSLEMEWMQGVDVFAPKEEMERKMSAQGIMYDDDERSPEETTLAWEYAYEDDDDRFGKASPKKPVKFRYRPELCLRADLSEESGFRLPLLTQMYLGNQVYVRYKYGAFNDDLTDGETTTDVLRRYALTEKGLTPPATLKKMAFCPWRPSTNDVWKLDMDDYEKNQSASLHELGDGVYRLFLSEGGEVDRSFFVTVSKTFRGQNAVAEAYAFDKLDKACRRCREKEVRKVMGDWLSAEVWEMTVITDWPRPLPGSLPEGKTKALTMWQMSDNVYIGILAEHDTGFSVRKYFFVKAGESGKAKAVDFFEELPSRAIGNAFLGAYAGEAEAMNNFAALLYCEIANPKAYDEERVKDLLRRAAAKGCKTAADNLDILRYNRGEKRK